MQTEVRTRYQKSSKVEWKATVLGQVSDHKPIGMWFCPGNEWIEWCEGDMPSGIEKDKQLVRFFIDMARVLQITTEEELRAFSDKYLDRSVPGGGKINWTAVAEQWAGIEVSPYIWKCRMDLMWYYSWDISSGCIWENVII
jgi:hypothetical protein